MKEFLQNKVKLKDQQAITDKVISWELTFSPGSPPQTTTTTSARSPPVWGWSPARWWGAAPPRPWSRPASPARTSCTPTSTTWRGSSGTREKQIAEERSGGITSDDDAASEVKVGKFWTRDQRRKHLEDSKERRRRQEEVIKSKPSSVKDTVTRSPAITTSSRRSSWLWPRSECLSWSRLNNCLEINSLICPKLQSESRYIIDYPDWVVGD